MSHFISHMVMRNSSKDCVPWLPMNQAAACASGWSLAFLSGSQIAARAVQNIGARRIFKVALGDPKSSGGKAPTDALFGKCIDEGCVFLEYGGEIDWSDARYDYGSEILKRWRRDKDPTAIPYDRDVQAMRRFRVEMRPGDIIVASDGYRHFRAVGEVTDTYEFHPREDGLYHRRVRPVALACA